MKAEALAPGANVSHALTKGTCPICAILKTFSGHWPKQLDCSRIGDYATFTAGRSLDREESFHAPRLGKA